MQQHRSIDVGDATFECTLRGLGAPVVLPANAGCSTGYFDHLARALVTGGFQTISINMRGVGGSSGSLDGATLHDLAGDVAGVIETATRSASEKQRSLDDGQRDDLLLARLCFWTFG